MTQDRWTTTKNSRGEIKRDLIEVKLPDGETLHIISGDHTHSDILRYVYADMGDAIHVILSNIIEEAKNDRPLSAVS